MNRVNSHVYNIKPDDRPKINKSLNFAYCGWEECTSMYSFGPAIRPHYLIHYISKGCGTYQVGDKTYSISEGDVFLITPGQSTIYTADKDNPWTYYWIGFNGDEANTILESCGFSNSNHVVNAKNPSEFESAIKVLLTLFKSSNTNPYLLTGNLFLCLAHLVQSETNVSSSISKIYHEKALLYIHTNYCYDIKIVDIAKHVGIDRTYLYKVFLEYSNLSPQQYLINYRLLVSQNLLKSSQLNVTEIAFSCGFKDVSSFNKHFKKNYNATPLQYKKIQLHY